MDKYINKIICGDCLEVMQDIPDKSVDLTVTSPPYDNLRDYEGYSFNFECIAKELYRIMKIGGVVVWVVKDQVVNESETGTSFKQALYFKKIGFNLHDTMIYQKNVMPFPEQTRYIQCFEYMFVFSIGKPETHNMIKEKTLGYKPSKSSCQRNQDGTTSKLEYEQGKEYRSKWNVWIYDVGFNKTTKDKIAYQHPAQFPEKLAADHIISWSNENDIVLDPMVGSGTTCKMAKNLNRRYIGIDTSEKYCQIARDRISNIEEPLF